MSKGRQQLRLLPPCKQIKHYASSNAFPPSFFVCVLGRVTYRMPSTYLMSATASRVTIRRNSAMYMARKAYGSL